MGPLLPQFLKTAVLGAGIAAWAAVAGAEDNDNRSRDFDRVIVIVMENHGFDNVIGALDPRDATGSKLITPFITQLALNSGLATYYFGVTHPSLPNYLSMIAGDFFGVQDDNDSCFNRNHGVNCHGFDVPNLIDQLEAHRLSWESLQQSMPSIGFLGSRFPARGSDTLCTKAQSVRLLQRHSAGPVAAGEDQAVRSSAIAGGTVELSHRIALHLHRARPVQ
jgi:phospholipase C